MKKILILPGLMVLIAASAVAAQNTVPQPKPPVTRAKRPALDPQHWRGIFFEDIFRDGLVGSRPQAGDLAAMDPPPKGLPAETTSPTGSWSELVEGTVLENEVKRWQLQLDEQITTPVRFKTSHQEISEHFSMLALWFAVIGQYESDVRWRDQADSVRTALAGTAAKSRSADISSFRNVEQRKEDLNELVRGGKFPELPGATFEQVTDWSSLVDRGPIMTRLELSVSAELKQATASEKDFQENVNAVLHEAAIVAALGRVLQLPEMLDADDPEYNAWAQQMLTAALDMKAAARVKDLDGVNSALNRINQACTQCHGDYR